jgi:hypothetical protein
MSFQELKCSAIYILPKCSYLVQIGKGVMWDAKKHLFYRGVTLTFKQCIASDREPKP